MPIINGGFRDTAPNDERLGADELAVLLWLLSMPQQYELVPDDVTRRMCWGINKTTRALANLRRCGYIVTERTKGADGNFNGTINYVYDTPSEREDR